MECNTITKTMINEFHENIRGRIHKRDFEGKKIMTVEKNSSLKEWEKQKITFTATEIPDADLNHTSPLVITIIMARKEKNKSTEDIEEWIVNRTFVDTGSSVDIMFIIPLKEWDIKMKKCLTPLITFTDLEDPQQNLKGK